MFRSFAFTILLLFLVFTASAALTPELEQELDETGEDELIDVIVEFSQDEENYTLNDTKYNYSVEEEFEFIDSVSLEELNKSEIQRLEEFENIERIEKDRVAEIFLEDSNQILGPHSFRDAGYSGENTSVAVLDTGIYNHRRLEIRDSVDFTGEGIGDINGHGTHVAGIVASNHPVYTGVAPETDLYEVKVMNGSGMGQTSDIIQGLEWSVKNDIDVISFSIGTRVNRCNGRDALSRMVNRAHNSGSLVVAAAGNSGPENSTLAAPGCAENALTVGSTNKDDTIASYSSRGPTYDGRIKPDVVAPGSNIISTWPENRLRGSSGTSMAAPQVSGQAALLLSKQDKSPTQLKNTIMQTSDDLGYPDNFQGSGRINITSSYNGSSAEAPETMTQRQGLWDRLRIFLRNLFRL